MYTFFWSSVRQVQMHDVATPLVGGLLLSALNIRLPSSSPGSFVLIFLLTVFPKMFPSITVLNSDYLVINRMEKYTPAQTF